MFNNRRSSQKPDEEFYAAFKQSFPDVGPGTSAAAEQPLSATSQQRSTSMHEASVDDSSSTRYMESTAEASKDVDATPKPFNDQWRLTPSIMDPSSFAFSAFVNQTPGYYTPTSGGFNNFYHSSAAGDLHTPGMGINTPLSLPQSLSVVHTSDTSFSPFGHFNPNLLHSHHTFQDNFHHQRGTDSQQMFVQPNHFLQHQDSGYSGLDDSPRKVTPTHAHSDMPNLQPGVHLVGHPFDHSLVAAGFPSNEKYGYQTQKSSNSDPVNRFRFHTTLNAPTAMVRHTEEIPITYLNKGQAYTMSIFDTARPNPHPDVLFKYRTYVRISFEDEQQRAKPGSCWQLWKEGRGSNEAHQRGGRLLAVEYVDPNQGGDEELRRSQIELEKASFDGFAVTWYPNSRATGQPDCSISVRFNFLSTDFSHSKGVKGIPVRLCAKTELITPVTDSSINEPEVCFSKVKLFRDHGAERKLSNDVAHVKKSIEKLKQQIAQAESGMSNIGKRKRSGSMAAKDGGRMSAEEDLHAKLTVLQDMFSSTRPVSVLFLKGEAEDDPDVFPVKLTGGDEIIAVQRSETWETRRTGSESPSSSHSPIVSTSSLTPKRKLSEPQVEDSEPIAQEEGKSPGRPVKLQKREHDFSNTNMNMVALDVDSAYQPPPIENRAKPVACFYVRQKDSSTEYYRAVYLMQRSVKDLVRAISDKFSVLPQAIMKVIHINPNGLHVIVDEEVVRELPEGQDMIVEFAPLSVHDHKRGKLEPWPLIGHHDLADGEVKDLGADFNIDDALELWLNY